MTGEIWMDTFNYIFGKQYDMEIIHQRRLLLIGGK